MSRLVTNMYLYKNRNCKWGKSCKIQFQHICSSRLNTLIMKKILTVLCAFVMLSACNSKKDESAENINK